MGNIVSVSQTYLKTNIGNLPLLLIELDTPVENGYNFDYYAGQLGTPLIGINRSAQNGDTPFSLEKTNVSYANGVITYEWDSNTYTKNCEAPSGSYSLCNNIRAIVHGTDDKYRVWYSTSTTYFYHISNVVLNTSASFGTGNYVVNGSHSVYRVADELENAILQSYLAPTYTWESLPQLSGNAGMFLMDLSTIDDSLIGDGSTPYETFDASGFVLVPQSDLYSIVQNLLNGQEVPVIYCGDNYVTATRRTTYVDSVTTVYVTLKFYFRSDVLIYTTPELIVYSTTTGISRDYFSMIYDEDQEVAATDIIQYWEDTGKIGINEYSLPSDEQMRALYIWLQDNGQEREQISPYDTGTTDNGGDPGTPTPQDHITDSPLPTLGGLDLGVVTLYLPSTEQLQSIAAFLWSDNVLDNFKKYFNNFADNLLSLYVLPFAPPGLNTKTFKVGNMVSEVTGVKFCTTRYIDRNMGTFDLKKLWDSYLDFSPYTRVEIYLPYLGLHSLDTDELMCPARMDGTLQRGLGSVLSLTYRLDLLTGVIVAKVKVNGEIRYQYEGRVGLTIPLTGQTYAQMAQAIVQAGAGVATTIASGGLTAPLTAAAAVTGTVNASKPNVERIGNISGDASMLATNVPYLIVTRPNKPLLDEQEIYTGFPSYKSGTLGNFSGFTQVIEAHVEGISCTEEERTLILKWLKEGVII